MKKNQFKYLHFCKEITDLLVSQLYVYPHTHITSDMCIPTGDTQNTEAHLGIR